MVSLLHQLFRAHMKLQIHDIMIGFEILTEGLYGCIAMMFGARPPLFWKSLSPQSSGLRANKKCCLTIADFFA
jgi:hypothetical protein